MRQSFEAANICACWLQSTWFDALHQPYFLRCNILLVGCLKIFTSTHLLTRHTTGGDSRHVRYRPGALHVTCTCRYPYDGASAPADASVFSFTCLLFLILTDLALYSSHYFRERMAFWAIGHCSDYFAFSHECVAKLQDAYGNPREAGRIMKRRVLLQLSLGPQAEI